jgi:thymidine kinase
MPKLYFRYGSMNSAKTANMLMMAFNYESKGQQVALVKPRLDNRFGEAALVVSRVGLSRDADLLVDSETDLHLAVTSAFNVATLGCVLVDEAQFLEPAHVEQLRELAAQVNVFCYGLRTDYRGLLFPGSKRLFELADTIEETKTGCTQCPAKATINAKFSVVNGVREVVKEGSAAPDLGSEDKYAALCWQCWSGASNSRKNLKSK